METRSAQRSLRTLEDLLELQARRAAERQQAVNEGIEQFVREGEARTKLSIRHITEPTGGFEARA